MLYRICKRLIERGQTAGLAEKIDVFYALGRITEAEYKAVARALRAAVELDPRVTGVPSTKGTL